MLGGGLLLIVALSAFPEVASGQSIVVCIKGKTCPGDKPKKKKNKPKDSWGFYQFQKQSRQRIINSRRKIKAAARQRRMRNKKYRQRQAGSTPKKLTPKEACEKRELDACQKDHTACKYDGAAATLMCGVGAVGTGGWIGGVKGAIIGGVTVTLGCAYLYYQSCKNTLSACKSRVKTACVNVK